ncbi:leukocyte surface antigen CD53-like [Polymixia lowei]
MTQSCLKCLKYTMAMVNLLFFIFGTVVLGFGVYMMMNMSNMASLMPALASVTLANILLIIGIIITCVSFLGFFGSMKENRCLLITFFILLFLMMLVELTVACVLLVYEKKIDDIIESELKEGLAKSQSWRKSVNSSASDDWDFIQTKFKCCGVKNVSDWMDNVPASCCSTTPCQESNSQYWTKGCYTEAKTWFQENFLSTGIILIMLCVIEVLGMCFALTLFCHISRSGLGYKL